MNMALPQNWGPGGGYFQVRLQARRHRRRYRRQNNACSVLDIYKDGSLKLDGFCKHAANPLAHDLTVGRG